MSFLKLAITSYYDGLNRFKGTDGKSLLLAEEVAAIKAELEHIQINDHRFGNYYDCPPVDSVPEELFRRFHI